MLDILFVTYNSEKWLEPCIKSLVESEYDLKQVTLNFFDNHSKDKTLSRLAKLKEKNESVFAAFRIGQAEYNMGFGAGNNRAAAMGDGEYVFCLNADTSVYPDTLRELMREIEQSPPDVGMWELRQFPYEHPKYYAPLTRETTWCSGACMVMKRALFEKLGGFDENIFLYAEDVDLSWRVRAAGYRLIYVPKAVINHYSYESAGQVKPNQYIFGLINNLYLRFKFGTDEDVTAWYRDIQAVYQSPEPFPGAKARLLKAYSDMGKRVRDAQNWNSDHRKALAKHDFHFIGWDYAAVREGAYYENRRPTSGKTVSVIIRTCGRPAVLRETLITLRNQTYRNFEVVIEEDGPETAAEMIRQEFGDLNIRYEATGEKVGRCRAGNMAMARATGDYLNFLDDDDLFYADHLETLVKELEDHPEYRIAFTLSFETPIKVLSLDPYQYQTLGIYGVDRGDFNRVNLSHHNLFPIQAVMFERGVYEELGGFDEELDMLEDWNLWVRYACRYAFRMAKKTTSMYRVPANRKQRETRGKELDRALADVRARHGGLLMECSVAELLKDYEEIRRELQRPPARQEEWDLLVKENEDCQAELQRLTDERAAREQWLAAVQADRDQLFEDNGELRRELNRENEEFRTELQRLSAVQADNEELRKEIERLSALQAEPLIKKTMGYRAARKIYHKIWKP